MKSTVIRSYAKINLSIDVIGKRPDGYHQVLMVMQQIDLFDFVTISWDETLDTNIKLSSNLTYLPVDGKNIAFKAAKTMQDKYPEKKGEIDVKIHKLIPVSAGLAGGSGNGAAVLHGLNALWETDLTVEELMDIGTSLGADVPFCIMGQAALNENLKCKGNLIGTCAIASGIGEKLEVIPSVSGWVILSKPPISVSTAQVYGNLKIDEIKKRANTAELVEGLKEKNLYKVKRNMINVLENVSLIEYPSIVYTKNKMEEVCKGGKCLMSGSGPTIFALFQNKKKAKIAFEAMEKICKENYLAKSL